MTTVLLLLLLGAVRWTTAHVIYAKDLSRLTRVPYDEWRPIREAPAYGRVGHGSGIRYPVFHKGYSYTPSKKILAQQTADHSENIEVFSPAPPTILGSFSVFGHATVNAREHASQITKKSPRPQLTPDYPQPDGRPKGSGYQLRHQYVAPSYLTTYNEQPKRPQRYNDFNEQAYYFDASLRPPPREINNKVSAFSPHAQSTSLTPNTYYFEQPQPFQSSGVDNSYHIARKPIKPVSHTPYRLSSQSQTIYPTSSPIDQFRTPTTNDFEPSSISFFNNNVGYNKNHRNTAQDSSYFSRNPFGDIHLSTRRPEHNVKPVTEDKETAKDVYEQYSHLGRPFQSSQPYTTTIESQKDIQTFAPFVTTYPSSSSEPHNVKFSDVAQPFQINDYQTQGSISSLKPDYIVTQQPYTQEVYPITVTTIDVPEENYDEPKNIPKETEAPYNPKPSEPTYTKPTNYDGYSNHRPQLQINSYQGFNDNVPPPFLPTPSTDVLPYLSEPTSDEQSTQTPDITIDGQDYNAISTVDNKYQETEQITEAPTTTMIIETTTKYRPMKRRRPSRPSHSKNDLGDSKLKNHRLTYDVTSTTTDYYKQQRRRKPSNKYREGAEYKRQRTTTTTTTTTTTPKQEIFDVTEPYIYTTDLVDEPSQSPKLHNENIINRPKEEDYGSYEQYYNSQQFPLGEVQIPENEAAIIAYEEQPSSTTTTTVSTTTTSTTTPIPPVSVTTPTLDTATSGIGNRLKSKYGNNRPRFSVKDYRERLNRATSTTSTLSPPPKYEGEVEQPVKVRNESTKYVGRIRSSQQSKSTTETISTSTDQSDVTTESKFRKYKSRIGPSRYKTSTTQQPESFETTTTERVNTFRPSTNRYKPGTGKYYSRYRTSTIAPKEVDDSPVTTARVTIKPKGVFSAKRRPFPMKPKLTVNKISDDDVSSGEDVESLPNLPKFGDSLKMNENEVVPDVLLKKMDDALTTTIASSEEIIAKTATNSSETSEDPTGQEAMRIADLTSSSSNDFHSSSVFNKGVTNGNRRTLPKITFAMDEPILPLEAFFQTHNKDK